MVNAVPRTATGIPNPGFSNQETALPDKSGWSTVEVQFAVGDSRRKRERGHPESRSIRVCVAAAFLAAPEFLRLNRASPIQREDRSPRRRRWGTVGHSAGSPAIAAGASARVRGQSSDGLCLHEGEAADREEKPDQVLHDHWESLWQKPSPARLTPARAASLSTPARTSATAPTLPSSARGA